MSAPSPASLWTLGSALAEIEHLRTELAAAHARGIAEGIALGLERAAQECDRWSKMADRSRQEACEPAKTIYGRDSRAAQHLATAIRALPAPEPAADGWRPTSEAPTEPGTYINVRWTEVYTYRWLAYKKDGARQMKAKGRWQRATEYGWDNSPLPKGEFVLNLPPPPASGETK